MTSNDDTPTYLRRRRDVDHRPRVIAAAAGVPTSPGDLHSHPLGVLVKSRGGSAEHLDAIMAEVTITDVGEVVEKSRQPARLQPTLPALHPTPSWNSFH